MADCWNVSWNVDPLALSVPDRLPLLPEDPPFVVEEEHAARTRAIATTGSPTAARLMR
jgi:hypothetical protein